MYELILDGVVTAAEVRVNDHVVGYTNDMHMGFAFDITSAVNPSATNTLEIEITNAISYARAVATNHSDPECKKFPRAYWPGKFGHGTECSSYIRQNTGSFGWDCTRAFVTQAISRSVKIRAVNDVVIDAVVPNFTLAAVGNNDFRDGSNQFNVGVSVFLTVAPQQTQYRSSDGSDNHLELTVEIDAEWLDDAYSFNTSVPLAPATPGQPVVPVRLNVTAKELTAKNVELWWTANFGSKQRQYEMLVTVTVKGSSSSSRSSGPSSSLTTNVGFRTFEFVGAVDNNTSTTSTSTSKPKWPLHMKLNNVSFFARGFNWMPVDVLPLPDDSDQTAMTTQLLEDAASIGATTIRIWGGGLYESDAFYSTADRLGLIVLQDGSFFGSYPDSEDFKALVRAEMWGVARRIGAHVSLVMWSGNNESPVYGNEDLFVATQLATVQEAIPDMFVYPSNPSYGWSSLHPLVPRPKTTDLTIPHDTHTYLSCGDTADGAMFVSEFGWPSAPILSSYQTVIPKDELYLNAPFQDYRSTIKNPLWTTESQPNNGTTLAATFPLLLNGTGQIALERWLYLTQALQSTCLTRSVERYRQSPQVMGTLMWSLGEIWTAPAWSSIQHDGQWKMLHYQARRLFEDVHVSFVRNSTSSALSSSSSSSSSSKSTSSTPSYRATFALDNHWQVPVNVSCELRVWDWNPSRTQYTANAKSIKKQLWLQPFDHVTWYDEPLTKLFSESAASGCSATDCFASATCSGFKIEPVNPCGGHRCDTAACPCGCECGTPTDPGLCYVPNVAETAFNCDEGEGEDNGFEVHTATTAYFAPLPSTAMQLEPELKVTVKKQTASATVTITAEVPVPHIFVTTTTPGVFSDNDIFFVPDQQKNNKSLTVTFRPRSAEGFAKDDEVFEVRVYSISNTAPVVAAV